jgi:hypothetical protein
MLSEKFPEEVKVRQIKKCLLKAVLIITPKKALSCFYGMGEWETEDWVDLLVTQGVSLSF